MNKFQLKIEKYLHIINSNFMDKNEKNENYKINEQGQIEKDDGTFKKNFNTNEYEYI